MSAVDRVRGLLSSFPDSTHIAVDAADLRELVALVDEGRDLIRSVLPSDVITYVDAWPAQTRDQYRVAAFAAHVHVRASGRCVRRRDGDLCEGTS